MNPADDQYGTGTTIPPVHIGHPQTTGSLPFTGFELWIFVLIAVGITLAGIALRVVTR